MRFSNYPVSIFFTLLLFASACQKKQGPPNILFIAVDDLRPALGAYGNPIVKTPHLDALAGEASLFENHFVQVPTCGASRFALLTGMRPRKPLHIRNNAIERELSGKAEAETPESFVHHLRRNGYRTVGIGKISHSPDGMVYGYEEPVSDIKEMPHSWDTLIFDHGKWGTGWNAFFGYASGENRQSLDRQVKPYEAADVDDEGYVDGITAQRAIEQLQELQERGQPFLLGVGFFKPHLPFTAPKKYWDLYDRDEIDIAPYPIIPKNIHLRSLHGSGEFNGYRAGDEKAGLDAPVSDAYAKKLRHAYYASVSYVDAQIGKVLDELEALGLADNTIVVVWGDHGWHLGDQQLWGKHALFNRALQSALIIKAPHIEATSGDVEAIVETVDIYPTLLDLCGIELPHSTDGESLAPLLENPAAEKEDVAYSYFRNGISMRTADYRLTRYFRQEEPTVELYDQRQDPEESINVAGENPEVVEQLMPRWQEGNTGVFEKEQKPPSK